MMVRLAPLAAIAAALALGTTSAQATGRVEVEFVQPENFADIGFGSVERRHSLDALRSHFVALGRRLPDGQVLKIEVLDVDLAGELHPWRRHPELRVLRGRADWPHMTLRWTLSAAGQPMRSAEDRIADMAYLSRSIGPLAGEALAYDRRMIDDWFAQRVLAPAP